jgi:hypothetical protein
MFFMTLSLYAFLKALEKGGFFWIAFSSFAIVLSLSAKYSTWIMLLPIPLIPLIFREGSTKATVYRSLVVCMITGVLLAMFFSLKHEVILQQLETLRTYQWAGLRRWGESFIATFLFQSHPFIGLAALYGIFRAARKGDKRFMFAAWFVLFVIILQVNRIRYLLPLFPLFTLMASYGLHVIRDRVTKRFLAYCIVFSSLALLYTAFIPFLNGISMVNLKDSGAFLNSLDIDTVEVFTVPQKKSLGNTEASIPILDLSTEKKVLHLGEPLLISDIEKGETSPLRFTWEVDFRKFYAVGERGKTSVLAVISSEEMDRVPDAIPLGGRKFTLIKRFYTTSEFFRYRTFVTLFQESGLSRKGQ